MKKTNNIKYFFLSIFALLLLAIFSSNRAMAVELDTVWVSDINGQVLFQHPVTKNILVAAKGGITELNSQDGKFARKLPINGNCIEMSPDGTKILYCADDGVRVFDYNTFEDYLVITTKYWHPKFLGNDKIVFLSGIKANTEIGVYNIQNKDLRYYPFFSEDFTAFVVSPNGKYISYATYTDNQGLGTQTKLHLMDAVTMQYIKELGYWENTGQKIQDIRFSPESKYLTYSQEYFNSDFPTCIYDLEKNEKIKTIDRLSLEYYKYEGCQLDLIGNNKYFIKLVGQDPNIREVDFFLKEIESDKIIFQNHYDVYNNKFDLTTNYLYCNVVKQSQTFCFDLNKIISGIPDVNPFLIIYKNRKLFIDNNNKPINNISILTIEGREVYRQNFNRLLNTNNTIEIPIELSNGLYLINITSGKESFTEKLLVIE